MTAPLQHHLKAPLAVHFLTAWYLPITEPARVGAKRWTAGGPLPYRAIVRVSGHMTSDADYPLMRVHTFAPNITEALLEGQKTDDRMQILVDYPGWGTVMPNGKVAHCDWAEISEAAHEEPYAAESVVTRMVSEYRLGLSLVAV